MSALRPSRRLAVLVTAWFALWLGALVASPLVGGTGLQLVCSGSSFKLVQPGQEDTAAQLPGHLGQCPACAHLAAPLPQAVALPPAVSPPAVPAVSLAAPPTRDAASPPAARGPPSFS